MAVIRDASHTNASCQSLSQTSAVCHCECLAERHEWINRFNVEKKQNTGWTYSQVDFFFFIEHNTDFLKENINDDEPKKNAPNVSIHLSRDQIHAVTFLHKQ